MKKFLIVLLCVLCVLGLSGLGLWLIDRSLDTQEEILGDSSGFDDGFIDSTFTQEDDKEDSSSSEENVYFTLPDEFMSGDYLIDLNGRVQVVPTCYPDYTYFTDYIVWTSSNPNIVSLLPLEDLVSSCYLIGESEGYSTITATYKDQVIEFEVGVSVIFGNAYEYTYVDGSIINFTSDSYHCRFELPCLTIFSWESYIFNECNIVCTSISTVLNCDADFLGDADGSWYVSIHFPTTFSLIYNYDFSFSIQIINIVDSEPYHFYVYNFYPVIRIGGLGVPYLVEG